MRCNLLREALLVSCLLWLSSGESLFERSILLELKRSVSDPSGVLSTWGSHNSPQHCSWLGVSCDSDSRVSSINITGGGGNSHFPFYGFGIRKTCVLGGGRLVGKLPPSMGKLTGLRVLALPFNDFSGEIPAEVWGLERLEVLDLEGNLFSGKLLDQFVGLRAIRVLNLAFNRIHGEIPGSLAKCVNLEVLSLSGNRITGMIPGSLGGLSRLWGFYLSYNRLTGSIPGDLGHNWHDLEHLDLSGNFLVGRIPASLGNCLQLRTLLLFSNKLDGIIPPEIGLLLRLEVLDVSRNRLSSPIPSELGDCHNLSVLVLKSFFDPTPINWDSGEGFLGESMTMSDSNYFQGSIPRTITSLPNLKLLWAPGAFLGRELPRNWGTCDSLEMVNLAQNRFQGTTNGVFRACKNLHFLDLSSNRLTGNLDEKLPVPCMATFDVSENLMSGPIPRFNYGGCAPVNTNHVQIPSFAYMSFLAHKARSVTALPFSDASFAVIHNFGGNNFTGPIRWLPLARDRLRKQVDYAFLAGGNKLTGSFPRALFGMCWKLSGMILNVSDNKLSGHIPLKMCNSLRFLDASGNKLQGKIPWGLEKLRNLTVLLLNNNKLSGSVPPGLANMASLSKFNVSCNNLSGLESTPYLRSRSVLTSYPPESINEISADDRLGAIEIASITAASAIVSVLLALVFLYFYTRMRVPKARVQIYESKEITIFTDIGVPVTFDKIIEATGSFNTSNCIGNGGFGATYKAEISPDTFVAVKRLAVGRFHGVQQFHAEIKTLGSVKHPNLVTLIGYHASESEMFLIYNYLPGGNLENFIKKRSAEATDWKILHKIALDIARALAYLHDQCAPRVLHRDVKPNNILLDNECNAYLSDFGLSRLLGNSETHVTTAVAGTFGYVAPEYALTCRVSEKSDVYSYGVVLLELLSDKKVLDPSFSSEGNGFNIVSWACMKLRQGQAKEVFTPRLWETGPHNSLVDALHLAVMCTVQTLSIRPTMKRVVRRLRQIQPPPT